MVSTSVDALAQAAFASSESIFAVDSPSSHLSQAIERLGDNYTISNQSPAVTTLQANADPFHKVQESAAANKDLTSVLATSDALLPAIPHLFKIASQRSAVVVHVETKERESESHHSNISNGAAKTGFVPSHADLMAVRQTGFAILTSDNAQTAFDLALVAQAAAVQTSTPFLNATSPSAAKGDKVVLDHQKVAPALVSELDLAQHKERQTAVSEISLSSLYLNPTPAAAADAAVDTPSTAVAAAATPEEIYNKVEELLVTLQKHTGRAYRPIDYQGNESSFFCSICTLIVHHRGTGARSEETSTLMATEMQSSRTAKSNAQMTNLLDASFSTHKTRGGEKRSVTRRVTHHVFLPS